MWEREASFTECVDDAWNYLEPTKNPKEVQYKLSTAMSAMKAWSRENFGSMNKEI
jgi:hypothetical protein